MGIYGPPGSGKTFTSLLIGEGLARLSGKRVAVVDTERGTDFYCQEVKARRVHPEAFDFDALYTRSFSDVLTSVRGLNPAEYGCVVIDSVTHLWEACIASFNGKKTSAGTIPMQAWGRIKKPYKDLMATLLSSPMHVIICGRQGTEYATDEETEELKAVGVKMKAEGETPYEPHILIRMESLKPKKSGELAQIVAYAEKDRTGVLSGRSFINPTFESMCAPLLGLLGDKQANVELDADVARDAEAMAEAEANRAKESAELLSRFSARIALADSAQSLKEVGRDITPQVKARMLPDEVGQLRETYHARELALRSTETREPGQEG